MNLDVKDAATILFALLVFSLLIGQVCAGPGWKWRSRR
jgi:hypothetical protein